MKTLFLIDAQGGGAMTHVLELAEGLCKAKLCPEILFFTKGPAIEEAKRRKISLHIIEKRGFGIVFLCKLCRFLQKNRYDLLHTHTINANFFGRVAGKLSGVPVIMTTVHSHIIDEIKGNKKPSIGDYLRYGQDLLLSRWSNTLVVVSETIRERLIKRGIRASKIRTIENGVDTDRFIPNEQLGLNVREELGIPREAKVLGIIGRLIPLKNHDVFLRAAKAVSDKRGDVCFLIVGDGPLMSNIREYAQGLNLQKQVIFTGWRTDIERIIHAINILVLCSQVEGHSVVILEAMACRKPVIGTDVRGIRSIVRQWENGILVPAGNSDALTEAMLYLLDHSSVAKSMGNNGRKIILQKYSVERMRSNYLELYREMGIR